MPEDLTLSDRAAALVPPDRLLAWCPSCVDRGRAAARKRQRDAQKGKSWAELAGVDQPLLD